MPLFKGERLQTELGKGDLELLGILPQPKGSNQPPQILYVTRESRNHPVRNCGHQECDKRATFVTVSTDEFRRGSWVDLSCYEHGQDLHKAMFTERYK